MPKLRSNAGTQQQNFPREILAARELLESEPRVMKRLVCRVAAQDTVYAEALFTLAAGKKFSWDSKDWQTVLDRLDECRLTVAEWIKGLDK